jgi:hypothetical protein
MKQIVNTTFQGVLLKPLFVDVVYQLEKGNDGQDADEQAIADWVLSQIRQPKDGKDADSEAITLEVLKRLPKLPNEADIIAKVLKQLPTPKASLKIIKEELDLDKDALLDEILKSPKLKVKFDGLDTSIKALDRRYIHGGGDTVSAGTNVTITNVNGTKQINALAGSFTILTTSDTIDDSNVSFTFTGTPSVVVINGQAYNAGATSGGVVMWTNVAAVVTLANPVGDGGSIFAFA